MIACDQLISCVSVNINKGIVLVLQDDWQAEMSNGIACTSDLGALHVVDNNGVVGTNFVVLLSVSAEPGYSPEPYQQSYGYCRRVVGRDIRMK